MAFTPLALAFLAFAAFKSRHTIAEIITVAKPAWLAATIALWATLSLVSPVTSWKALQGYGLDLPYKVLLSIHLKRLPARYLPGGIWHTATRVMDLNDMGVNRPRLAAMVVLENIVPLAVTMLLGSALLLIEGDHRLPLHTIAGIATALVVLTPLAIRLTNRQLHVIRMIAYIELLASVLFFWLLASLAFLAYLAAFPTMPLDAHMIQIAGAYLLSWAAGFIAVFAPQGLGVFESVVSLLLRGDLPFVSMAVIVAGFRACMLAGDFLAYFLYWLFRNAPWAQPAQSD